MAMRFGIHIGRMGGPLHETRKLWKFADANGFDWFSVSDHFQESRPCGDERSDWLRGTPKDARELVAKS